MGSQGFLIGRTTYSDSCASVGIDNICGIATPAKLGLNELRIDAGDEKLGADSFKKPQSLEDIAQQSYSVAND